MVFALEQFRYYKEAKVKGALNMGGTTTLEILPLVDRHTDRGDLKGEAGASYLALNLIRIASRTVPASARAFSEIVLQ